jgi:hypothetical protein
MSKEDPNARRMASGVFRYGLSAISVAVSLSITLLLRDYTFRTPVFFPAILLRNYTGISETELLGWQWIKVLHPDDREPTLGILDGFGSGARVLRGADR